MTDTNATPDFSQPLTPDELFAWADAQPKVEPKVIEHPVITVAFRGDISNFDDAERHNNPDLRYMWSVPEVYLEHAIPSECLYLASFILELPDDWRVVERAEASGPRGVRRRLQRLIDGQYHNVWFQAGDELRTLPTTGEGSILLDDDNEYFNMVFNASASTATIEEAFSL